MRCVAAQLPLRPGVIHLPLKPRPVIKAAQRLVLERQDCGRVVIGEVGFYLAPSLPERRQQQLPEEESADQSGGAMPGGGGLHLRERLMLQPADGFGELPRTVNH